MEKELSIICPCLNCWSMTQRMIESIKVSEPYDLIIVDNGSTDGTLENLKKIAGENNIPFEKIDGDTVSLSPEEKAKSENPPPR